MAKSTTDLGFLRLEPEAFARAPQKSIDYAVMEKTDRAAVVAGNFRWSDIGSWDAIFDIAERDKSGNAIHGTVVTTDASCGAVNAMHDSFTPLGGLVPLANIQLGEVVFGGVGAGLYGILVFVLLSVFIAGLMVGRTPEYLGKKIRAREMTLSTTFILATELAVLVGTGIAMALPGPRASRTKAKRFSMATHSPTSRRHGAYSAMIRAVRSSPTT